MLSVHTLTHPGKVRDINEDAVLSDPDVGLIAVADGMGGHNAGEVASQLALEAIRGFLHKSARNDDFTWPFGVNPEMSLAANRLLTAIKIANRRVLRASEERAEYTGMGTTVVAGIVEGQRLTFSSVGDSRLYEMRGGDLRQVSRDDSWIVMLSDQSGADVASLKQHPMRNVLTNVVGARDDVHVPIGELALEQDQLLLLSTDGAHGAVSNEMLASILKREPDLTRAATSIVAAALERGGLDNISVLLARYVKS